MTEQSPPPTNESDAESDSATESNADRVALEIGKTIDVAVRQHQAGHLAEAEQLYRAILEVLPGNPQILHMLGVALNQSGRHEEAVAYLAPAADAIADDPGVHNNYGNALRALGRPREAEAAFRRALEIAPDHALAHNNLGNAMRDLGDHAAAIDCYRRALEIDPQSVQALSNLGLAYTETGQFDEAVERLDRAIAIAPDFAPAHNNLANTYLALGDTSRALTALQRALEIDPGMVEAASNLGMALIDQGRLADALTVLDFTVATRPDFAVAHNNRGTALQALGRNQEAAEAYGRALEIDPGLAEARGNLGTALKAAGLFAEALDSLRRAIELAPDNARAHSNLGDALMEAGAFEDAAASYAEALRRDPELVEIYAKVVAPLTVLSERNGGAVTAWIEERRTENPNSAQLSLLDYTIRALDPATAADACRVAMQRTATEGGGAQFGSTRPSTRPPTGPSTGPSIGTGVADAPSGPTRAVALLRMGRSGAGFLHSLLDGHSGISTLPGLYLNGFFGTGVWDRIKAERPEQMAERFAGLYEALFDANNPAPVPGNMAMQGAGLGSSKGLVCMGADRETVLRVDRGHFVSELTRLLAETGAGGQGDFFRLLHAAFERTIGRGSAQDLMVHMLHSPDAYSLANHLRHFPEMRLLMVVRDPLESFASWIAGDMTGPGAYPGLVGKLIELLYRVDRVEFGLRESAALRLEDLKRDPDGTLARLCRWLGIEEEEALRTPTVQGLRWWGDPGSTCFGQEDPWRETDPEARRGAGLLGERDCFVLTTLLRPFNALHGYAAADEPGFDRDLVAIEPMIEEPFEFETALFAGAGEPAAHGHFAYLRTALRARWRVLDTHRTYPGMIQPLA